MAWAPLEPFLASLGLAQVFQGLNLASKGLAWTSLVLNWDPRTWLSLLGPGLGLSETLWGLFRPPWAWLRPPTGLNLTCQGLAWASLTLEWASLGLAQASWVGGTYGWMNG